MDGEVGDFVCSSQCVPQLDVVVDLAVVHEHVAAGGVAHGLAAALAIEQHERLGVVRGQGELRHQAGEWDQALRAPIQVA